MNRELNEAKESITTLTDRVKTIENMHDRSMDTKQTKVKCPSDLSVSYVCYVDSIFWLI